MAFIKASHLHANIESIDRLAPAAATEVKRRAAAVIAQSLSLSRSHWAPLAHDLEIADTIFDVVGARGLRDLNADAIRVSADGPLLRPIRDASRRLIGPRPDAILRFVHHAWGAIFKDVGEAQWVPDADNLGGTVLLTNQPDLALASRAWPEGCAGAIEGVFQFVNATGTVKASIDHATHTMKLIADWRPSSSAR